MIGALTPVRTPRLMEEEGIGCGFAAAQRAADAGKNEVAIETLEVSHAKLDAGARGIIAILIGL